MSDHPSPSLRRAAVRGAALVTGGSRGLGSAIARHLAGAGWHTVICGRDPDSLDAAVKAAADDGIALHAVRADVTDEDSVAGLFDHLAVEAPPLGLCVNNAGNNFSRRLVSVRERPDGPPLLSPHPLEDFERVVTSLLTGTFLVGRHAAQAMLAAGTPGAIVNISSTVRRGAYGQSAYCAAKSGVEALTRTWATELGEYGIRVSAVAPGVVDGEALRRRSAASERHAAYMADLRRHVPLRRWCDERDVAEAVAFAADNPSVTGTVLEVDAGGLPARVLPPAGPDTETRTTAATADLPEKAENTA
ncbi:SDR family NAD(P)-dependent oxidoreductase [Streptomyces californicus]|uniref:SDR family NAD(P)-dependent oxidoreductase n=1 Tax=Streptomyces californicus TaxID=67351 RepID=UPI001E37E1FC|nr:SDR family oxidoreductase [Streptomyces californicus]MCC0575640.1 SDR family oxidoreductase [Streptomyces californicus]